MKKSVFMAKYPVYELSLLKEASKFRSVDEIIDYLKNKIQEDKIAAFIGEFNPYCHTQDLGGEIADNIHEAKEVIFCFGQKLPNATIVAVRPRAIGVVDKGESFVVNFMEAPNEPATQTMIEWVESIKK
jgi:hypothetical protein